MPLSPALFIFLLLIAGTIGVVAGGLTFVYGGLVGVLALAIPLSILLYFCYRNGW